MDRKPLLILLFTLSTALYTVHRLLLTPRVPLPIAITNALLNTLACLMGYLWLHPLLTSIFDLFTKLQEWWEWVLKTHQENEERAARERQQALERGEQERREQEVREAAEEVAREQRRREAQEQFEALWLEAREIRRRRNRMRRRRREPRIDQYGG